MTFACNIDQRGRKARVVGGALTGLGGIICLVFGWPIPGTVLCLTGGFMIFEGAKGWCALRALGIKTKL